MSDEDAIPADIIADMKKLGLFGLTIPREFGGLELTLEETVILIATLCRAAAAFRSYTAGNVGVASQSIMLGGTEAQKRKYLPGLASGETLGSFCLTEPEAGSDAASIRTSARREGPDFVINGTKRFITNSPSADLFVVLAKTNSAVRGADGISAFLVPAGTPGVVHRQAHEKDGTARRPNRGRDVRRLSRSRRSADRWRGR